MIAKTVIEKWWAGVDRGLLFLVFALLAFSVWESTRFDRGGGPAAAGEPLRRFVPEEAVRSRPPLPRGVVAGTPVSLSRSRVSRFARDLQENGWEGVPSSLAADMRERNGSYEIFFALPQRTDPSSVKVSTSGNVLTLFVNSSGTPAATFVKQFYIPCGADRAGKVETSVSNDIVRVRICQKGG